MKKALTVSLLLITIGAIAFSLLRKGHEEKSKADLFINTSDAAKITRVVTIAGDDWLGYAVCRSPRFAQLLAAQGIGVKFEMAFDFQERVQGLADGTYQFAVITLDSYLSHGENAGWPGVALWTIDESFGGDAIVAKSSLPTLDSLDNAKGAFTSGSPSEFFLRSQITHFRLDNLRQRMPSMGKNSVEETFNALKSGQADFAVLWEPFKTKALQEIPDTKVLIDTTQAQGLIIDIFLASRTELSQNPQDVAKVAQAYFETLHEWLNSPATLAEAALRDINARDHKKSMSDAEEMLKGIQFASLQDNTMPKGWMGESDPKLATSIAQISRILENQGIPVRLQQGDPNTILLRKPVKEVTGIAAVANAKPPLGTYYQPLSTSEWTDLSKKIKGTLLDTPILFRPGQSEIPEETQEELKEAAPKLAHYPSYRIIVEAHSFGNSPEVDKALSEERAAEVKRFLMWECSIPDERILATGKGDEEALAQQPGENPAAHARRNRRARILLVGE